MEKPIQNAGTRVSDTLKWGLLQKKAQELRAAQAFELFRQEGVEPILIKGPAAAIFYPDSNPRLSIDLDLAVSDTDFDRASNLCRSDAARGLAIDLHRELRHLDTVEWQDLIENSRPLEFGTGSVRVLRPEDHFRVLAVHWLTDGGTNKDRLWDVYYLIDNRAEDFDWERCLNVVSDRRRRWLICTLGLAGKYLGLDLAGTPASDAVRDLPPWLIKTVEKEWANELKPLPLENFVKKPAMFFRQLRRRVPPNPIWATVQMEGSFDAWTRVYYQAANFIYRILPSYKRVSNTWRATER